MTGPEVRAQLATVVRGVVPPDWTVYEGPTAASFPAVTILTTEKVVGTFCAEIHRIQVVCLEAASAGIPGYDSVDVMASVVLPALTAVEGLQYESTTQGPMVTPLGVDAYGATLNVQMYVN